MKKGFTLIELLAAITIMGILALLILPNFIEKYNSARNNAMITQENEVVDAAKLFIEDYCRHPLSENEGMCQIYSVSTSNTNEKYTCLNVIQNAKYIDEIIQQNRACSGFVTYDKSYKSYKAYLKCADGYKTNGIDNIKDLSGAKIIEKCN